MSEVLKEGVSITKKILEWELHNFATFFSYDMFIKQQKFTFQVTSSEGVTSNWSVSLDFMEDCSKEQNSSSLSTKDKSNPNPTQYLSLAVALVSTSNGKSFVNAEIIPEFEGIEGSISFKESSGDSSQYEAGKSHFWLIKSMPKYGEISYLLPTDGTLMINLELTIFDITDQSDNENGVEARLVSEEKELFYQMISPLENDKTLSDVLMISKDGMEYYAHSWILSEGSDVFNAMFTMEIVSDVMKMDDLSGKAVEILLHFIYTGKMAEEWKTLGTIEEVMYLADKYQIGEMKDYIDVNISKLCTIENAKRLFVLVNRYGLKRGVSEIHKFILEQVKDEEQMFEMLNN